VIAGFTAYEFIPSQPLPPAIWVYPEDVEYHPTSSGVWIVQAVVALNIDRPAQELLRGLLDTAGATSVKAAIEAEPTLGATVDDVIVVSAKGFQLFDLPTLGVALGSTWTLNVVGTG
jgi:hypothetical protein